MRIDKSANLGHSIRDSGDGIAALTRKGSSGGEVPIRDSLAN